MVVTLFQVITSVANAQEEKISIRIDNKSVKDVLNQIESESNYRFFYNEGLIDVKRKVSIDIKDEPIHSVLDELFKGTDVKHELKGNLIVLSNQPLNKTENEPDIKTVTGQVTDKQGQPIPGASVLIKGSSTGTISDLDGKFTLPDISSKDILVISFIGMISKEVAVGDKMNITVVLEENVVGLDEVVVIGYGTIQKKDLTGSIATVKTEDLALQPVASVGDALQGKAAGVNVISSGEPGSNVTFRIRGTGTINSNSPLVVVDGFPINGGINQVNTNDIESIQVLKDASATAIYGSRGANGVIIITTKRGDSNKPKFNFTYYHGLQSATNMVDMLNASEFAQLHNEMLNNNGIGPNSAFANPATLGKGTDWLDAMFKVASIQNYSLSYSGGNEKSNIYVSGGYLDQDGIVIKTGFKRYLVQFNTDTKINDFLKFGNSIKLEHDIKTKGDYNIQNAMKALPTQPIYREDGNYSGTINQSLYDGDIENPIGKANVVKNSTKGYNAHGTIYGELKILEGLKLKSIAGLETNFWNDRTWSPAYEWDSQTQENSYLYQASSQSITWMWDNTLTFDKTLATDHRINAMIGSSAQANRYEFMNGSIEEFASDATQQLNNGTSGTTLHGNASEWSIMSYMGRANYVFKDKYYLTGTVRFDGSSRFGENNKWGTFPSASAAWRISNEPFFSGISPYINDLKLRAGYGVTGNLPSDNYDFASVYDTYAYNFNGTYVSAVVADKMPNPNLHWEGQKQFNMGFDAAFLNNRINLTTDVYKKNTEDMLVPMAVPISTGYSDEDVPYINAGKITNKGIEFTVSSKNIDGDFSWTTDLTMSFNKNKVVSINDTTPMSTGSIGLNYYLAIIEAGHPINEFYGYVTDGIFQTQEEVDNHAVQVAGNDPYNRTSAGDIRFKDLNNDGVIDDDDRTYIGNPNPKFIYSLNNSFSYKGFDLDIYIQGVYGNKIINANRFYTESMSATYNQTKQTLTRWTGEGTSNSMPRAVYSDPNNNNRASNRFVENGSYLRLKNVTFGYNIPAQLLEKVKLSTVKLYISGQNLLTFTKYEGFDPEVSVDGIDNNLYPVTKTISFGINIGL